MHPRPRLLVPRLEHCNELAAVAAHALGVRVDLLENGRHVLLELLQQARVELLLIRLDEVHAAPRGHVRLDAVHPGLGDALGAVGDEGGVRVDRTGRCTRESVLRFGGTPRRRVGAPGEWVAVHTTETAEPQRGGGGGCVRQDAGRGRARFLGPLSLGGLPRFFGASGSAGASAAHVPPIVIALVG